MNLIKTSVHEAKLSCCETSLNSQGFDDMTEFGTKFFFSNSRTPVEFII